MTFEKKLNSKNKVVVVLGPTASGKSEMAVRLAKKFNGEVISADSRQVYRHLDVGTGKVPRDANPKFEILNSKQIQISKSKYQNNYFYKGIRHHLIDVASPRRQFSAARFQKLGQKALRDILRRKKLPIICGGTGFYIDALLSGRVFPNVPSQASLRRELEKCSAEELFEKLRKLDPKRAEIIDGKNKRRLIRAFEIIECQVDNSIELSTRPKGFVWKLDFQILKIGLLVERDELKKRIGKRFLEWMRQGFLEEVRGLHEKQGLSWKRIEGLGLNYRAGAEFLQGKISKDEMIKKSLSEIYKYSKRQMTWFRRDKNIRWVRTYGEAYLKIVRGHTLGGPPRNCTLRRFLLVSYRRTITGR